MKTQIELQTAFKKFLDDENVDAAVVAIGPKGAHVAIENFLDIPQTWKMTILFAEKQADTDEDKPRKTSKQKG